MSKINDKNRTFYSQLVSFFFLKVLPAILLNRQTVQTGQQLKIMSAPGMGGIRNGFFGQFFAMFAITSHNTGIPQLVLFFGPQATALFEKPH